MRTLVVLFLALMAIPNVTSAQIYELVQDAEVYRSSSDMCLIANYARDKDWERLQRTVNRLRASGGVVRLRAGVAIMPVDIDAGCRGRAIKLWGGSDTFWVVEGSMKVRKKVGMPGR